LELGERAAPALLRLVAYAFVDNLGCRQWLAVWRVWALVEVLLGRGGWGSIAREGARPGDESC
jgi:hypothetical protein